MCRWRNLQGSERLSFDPRTPRLNHPHRFMKSDNPSPAAHLVRFGVAIARGGLRLFLRDTWAKMRVPETQAFAAFETAVRQPSTYFELGLQPWTNVLANALRRVARLFADRALVDCISGVKAGGPLVAVLNGFAPLCAEMDAELEASGFAVRMNESDDAILESLHPYLPRLSGGAVVEAASVWLPGFFSGLMNACLWREIIREPAARKLAAEHGAAFFTNLSENQSIGFAVPTTSILEEAMIAYADGSIGSAVSRLSSVLQPQDAIEVESRLIPFLRTVIACDVPPVPVLASVPQQTPHSVDSTASPSMAVPAQETLVSIKASAKGVSPAEQTAVVVAVQSASPPSSEQESSSEVKREIVVLPPPRIPPVQPLRPVLKPNSETSKPGMQPIIPPPDDDDDELEEVEKAAVRDVRWIVGGIGVALIGITLFAVFGRGFFSGPVDGPVDGPVQVEATVPTPEPGRTGPEKIAVNVLEPLAEPVPVAATPTPPLRLFEHAQAFIESAGRAKASGDNRQSAEDLSRALLVFKQELGESRWKDPRYVELRAQYRSQLELLEFSKEQIAAIEETLGAREPVEAEPAGEPGLAKMTALFKRGDEEITNGRPRAAAEAYESGLRSGMEVLGQRHLTDRAFQAHLSRYIDFLIGEGLEPEELQSRLLLVRKGKKPGPLPAKRTEPESGGLGLPKL